MIRKLKSINFDLYKSHYMISHLGEVISMKNRKIKYLKPTATKNGYLRIKLSSNIDGGKSYLVHRLVAERFLLKKPNKTVVNHKDGNKSNNHIDNLEFCTQKENVRHAVKMGLFPSRKGSLNGRSKLTTDDVFKIRNNYKNKRGYCGVLAREYNVNVETIRSVIKNKTWN